MSLLDPRSAASSKAELDLFSVPPTQTCTVREEDLTIHLQAATGSAGPFTFVFPRHPTAANMAKNMLEMRLRMVDAEGEPVQLDANVFPINLLASTFFNDLKVWIEGKLVHQSNNMYHYQSIFETELNYGTEAKSTQLQSALYYRDEPGKHESVTNKGAQERLKLFANGANG